MSTDATLDDADTAVGPPLVKTLKLNAGASKPLKVKLSTPCSRERPPPGAATGSAASAGTINIAAPFTDLSGAFGVLPSPAIVGRKGVVSLTITNSGNVNAKAAIDVALVARPVAGGSDVPIPATPAKLNLTPGASKAFKLKIAIPGTLEPGITYNLGATLDALNVLAKRNESNDIAF